MQYFWNQFYKPERLVVLAVQENRPLKNDFERWLENEEEDNGIKDEYDHYCTQNTEPCATDSRSY